MVAGRRAVRWRWRSHTILPMQHDVRPGVAGLPGKGNSDSHGARPVHQIIWIRNSKLSTKTFLSVLQGVERCAGAGAPPAINPQP